jgi:hypothetical protein
MTWTRLSIIERVNVPVFREGLLGLGVQSEGHREDTHHSAGPRQVRALIGQMCVDPIKPSTSTRRLHRNSRNQKNMPVLGLLEHLALKVSSWLFGPGTTRRCGLIVSPFAA